jgi:hypothetical protein
MSPHSLSPTTCNSYEHSDGRYPGGGRHPGDGQYAGGGRYADGDRYPTRGRYPENRWYQDDSQYSDARWYQGDNWFPDNRRYEDDRQYPDNLGRPRQQIRRKPRPTHRRNRHKERPTQGYVEYSSSNCDDESDQEVRKPTRKKKVASLERFILEDQIMACVKKLYEKKIAEEKQREADEKEKEEKSLKAQMEADEIHKAELKKALDDQAAAMKKEAEDKNNATEAELARQQQRRRETDEEIRRVVAAKTEADRLAAEDKMRALREKAEADGAQAARWTAEVAEQAEKLCAARIKEQAEDLNAADRAQRDKMAAENIEKILILTRRWLATYESGKELKAPPKNAASRRATGGKIAARKMAIPEGTGIHDGSEETIEQLKELLCAGSKDDNLGLAATSLEERAHCEGGTETESLRVEASDSTRGSKGTVGQRKDAKAPKERKRDGKSNRKANGEEKYREYKGGRSKNKSTSGSRKPALRAMRWFASC